MTLYQLSTISTEKFEAFLAQPSDVDLQQFSALLFEDTLANEWFAEDPPVWKSDPESWVKKRLAVNDWYANLSEPEMLAWDHAMRTTLESSEMQSTATFTALPVDGIPTLLFELAAEATEQAGNDSKFLQMRPLRFHKLPSEIEEREPYERVYWPSHAVVPPADAAKMVDVFNHYDTLISGLTPRDPATARRLESEGLVAARDIPHLLTFLGEVVAANATWYARFDY